MRTQQKTNSKNEKYCDTTTKNIGSESIFAAIELDGWQKRIVLEIFENMINNQIQYDGNIFVAQNKTTTKKKRRNEEKNIYGT